MNRRNLLKTLSAATAVGLSGSMPFGALAQDTPKKTPTAPPPAPAPPPPVLTQDPNT